MPYEDTIEREHRLVRTRVWGSVTFAEVLDHYVALRSRPDFDPSFNQLIDATDLVDAKIDADQAWYIGTRPLFSPGSKRALVVVNDAPYGVGRMLMSYREMAGTKENMLVTRDMKAALEFLGLNEASAKTP